MADAFLRTIGAVSNISTTRLSREAGSSGMLAQVSTESPILPTPLLRGQIQLACVAGCCAGLHVSLLQVRVVFMSDWFQ